MTTPSCSPPLLPITRGDLARGLALFERSDRLRAFDAVLAATASGAGASAIVSADAAFATLAELPHVMPDTSGVAAGTADQQVGVSSVDH